MAISYDAGLNVIVQFRTNIPVATLKQLIKPSITNPHGTAAGLVHLIEAFNAGDLSVGTSGTLTLGSGTVSAGPGAQEYSIDLS